MPYRRYANKSRVRRRPARRNYRSRRNMPLSKTQARAVRSLALKTAEKTREQKVLYAQCDEFTFNPFTGTVIVPWTSFDSGLGNQYVLNSVMPGSNSYQRVGNTLNPKLLQVQGLLKFDAATLNFGRRVLTRVALGYLRTDYDIDPASCTTDDIMMKAGATNAPTGDYRDIMSDFNWAKFKPIYDKTFTLIPATYVDQTTPSNYYIQGTGKDYARFFIKHKFSPKQEISYNQGNPTYDRPKSGTLVMLIFSRVMSDDVVTSTLNIEMTAVSKFVYSDA